MREEHDRGADPVDQKVDASQFVARVESSRGRNSTQVLPFARTTRQPEQDEVSSGWKLKHTAGPAGRGTDVETAVRQGIAALQAGRGSL